MRRCISTSASGMKDGRGTRRERFPKRKVLLPGLRRAFKRPQASRHLLLGLVMFSLACAPIDIVAGFLRSVVSVYYVALDGDDIVNDCTTWESACRTIEGALERADAGDIIRLSSGDHALGPPITISGVVAIEGQGRTSTRILSPRGRSLLVYTDLALQDLMIESTDPTAGSSCIDLLAPATLRAWRIEIVGCDNAVTLREGTSASLVEVALLRNRVAFNAAADSGNSSIYGSVIEGNSQYAAFVSGRARVFVQDTLVNDNGGGSLPSLSVDQGSLMLDRTTVVHDGEVAIGLIDGELSLTNSTLTSSGVGIRGADSTLSLVHSTIVAEGSSIDTTRTVNRFENTLLTGGARSCQFRFSENEYLGVNLAGGRCVGFTQVELELGPLADNGGPTPTHALLEGSPAIDAATGECPATDQRGVSRPVGGGCDVGAYEYEFALLAATAGPTETAGVVEILPPTETPVELGPPLATFRQNTNCRAGPSTLYDIVRSFLQGETATVEGKNGGDPRWWWLLIPGTNGHCWVSDTTVDLDRPGDELEVIIPPPPPTVTTAPQKPAAPEKLAIVGKVCNASEYTVTLGWNDVAGNETGFRVYRDGSLIATLGPNAGGYTDDPPGSGPYTYGVEAFNDAGASSRPTVDEEGCLY